MKRLTLIALVAGALSSMSLISSPVRIVCIAQANIPSISFKINTLKIFACVDVDTNDTIAMVVASIKNKVPDSFQKHYMGVLYRNHGYVFSQPLNLVQATLT